MTKPFKIWIKDKETVNKVLAKMEKEGIKWWGSKDSPCMHRVYVPIALFVGEDSLLSHAGSFEYYELHSNNEITPEEYLKEDKTMTKADLKDWMIVEDDLERRYFVDRVHGWLLQYDGGQTTNIISDIDLYTDDLRNTSSGRYITKVFEPGCRVISHILDGDYDELHSDYGCLIWERPESVVEMTIAEIEEKLGIKNLKIVKEDNDD